MVPDKVNIIEAEPYPFEFHPAHCALLIIDMQRDFLEPGGFGEMLGNDVSQLRRTIEPEQEAAGGVARGRAATIHTREGHRPDLADLPPTKRIRGRGKKNIGDAGPMGRILVRGEEATISSPSSIRRGRAGDRQAGQGRVPSRPICTHPAIPRHRQLVVTGVTTEVCVNTTIREANDRGYDCLVLEDCVGSYFPEFQKMGLEMIKAQGAIFGWVGSSKSVIEAVGRITR